ncbi:hypothetical protein ACOMCU_15885 [Lysinibacillus sp. UGB7]|uniref:hypothetical protein n=1 Tax=Lysinibacillus sp. UGB7 TaxID=3411039 RepID=UPI003B7E8254
MFSYYILLFPKKNMSFIYPNFSKIRAFSKSKALEKYLKRNKVYEDDYLFEVYTVAEILDSGIMSYCHKFLEEKESKKASELERKILFCLRKKYNIKRFYEYLSQKTDLELIELCNISTHYGIIFIRQLSFKDFCNPVHRSLVLQLTDTLENAPFTISNFKVGANRENMNNLLVNFYLIVKKYEDLWHEIHHSNNDFDIITEEIFKPKFMALFDQTD